MSYTISRNGQQFGPYSREDVQRYLLEGRLLHTDLAWRAEDQQWVTLAELLPAAPAPPPPFPAPPSPPPPAPVTRDAGASPIGGPDFSRALYAATPTAFVTPTLMALNVIVFALMVARGVSLMDPSVDNLIQWGADFGPLTLHGEWWRLVTNTFLHIGIIHLAFNMYVLYFIGKFTERLFGNLNFTVLYLLSGIGGSIASLYWNSNRVSAGASGAIFGLYGGLLAFLLLQRHTIPAQTLKSIATNAFIFLGYNLVYGMAGPGIDVSAHMGGLGSGFVFGLILTQSLTGVSLGSRLVRSVVAVIAGAGLAVAAIAMIPKPPRVDGFAQAVEELGPIESKLFDLYNTSVKQYKDHQLNAQQLAKVIETNLLPPWDAQLNKFSKLDVPTEEQPLQTAMTNYLKARSETWSLFARYHNEGDHDDDLYQKAIARQTQTKELAEQFKAMYARYQGGDHSLQPSTRTP